MLLYLLAHTIVSQMAIRFARFFLTQYTKWGKITQLPHYVIAKNIPDGCKIFQMTIKSTNIFNSKALQNLPNLGFLV
jgi:hypothetical protein